MTSVQTVVDPPLDPAANMARDLELAEAVRARQAPPTLRIYRWARPAISIGRRQQASELGTWHQTTLRYQVPDGPLVPGTDLRSLSIVRRPTGGGAVVHRTEGELTYALALPLPELSPVPDTESTGYRAGSRYLVPGTGYQVPVRGLPGALHGALRDLLVEEGLFRPEELTVAEGNCRGPFTLCFEAPVCGDLLYKGRKVAGSALRVWRDGLLIQGSIQGLPVEYNRLVEMLQSAVKERLLHEENIAVH